MAPVQGDGAVGLVCFWFGHWWFLLEPVYIQASWFCTIAWRGWVGDLVAVVVLDQGGESNFGALPVVTVDGDALLDMVVELFMVNTLAPAMFGRVL